MSRSFVAIFFGLVLGQSAPLYSAESPATLHEGPISCWIDADDDTYGDPAAPDPGCGPGSVENDSDCDDTNADIYPGAIEIVGNDVDENCDSTLACWLDQDADLFGGNSSAEGFQSCTDPGASENNFDCDDLDPDVFPGAFDEPVDGVDSNCDGNDYDAGADTDGDTRNDGEEDANNNGDVSDDDYDDDKTPNYLDLDDDGDSVPTEQELDEDTDLDGAPNFLDNDDDGDTVPTIDEDVEIVDGDPTNDDTDNDGLPNYLDDDDDNDGVLTADEDANGNGDPTDDDTDNDGIPNYLDADDPKVHDDGFEDPL